MDRRLYEASLRGDVSCLMELLEEDQLALHKAIITDFYGTTPLHIAAMCSYVDFAVKLLSLKPELASELDSQGFYPLHLASAEKNVDMVKVLLEADSNVCSATDQDGRTPLHLAAMKGRVEIMKVLIQKRPEAIQVLSDPRETILHLCVKHNRLEALKLLVEHLLPVGVPIDDQEESNVSVNSKDNDGNTILHLAVARRQMKMIRYLLASNIGVELKATNNKGFTAMDIVTQSEARDLIDMEIRDLLQDAGVGQSGHHDSFVSNCCFKATPGESSTIGRLQKKYKNFKEDKDAKYDDETLRHVQNTLMVVASLIAGIAFQGGVNPPGGVWQGNVEDTHITNVARHLLHENIRNSRPAAPAPRIIGTSVMVEIASDAYILFMSFNTIGFLASLSIIFLLISGLGAIKRKSFVTLLKGVLWVSITFMALTYMVAVACMYSHAHHNGHLHYPQPITNTIFAWFGLLAIVLFVHTIRFIQWLLKKSTIQKIKEVARCSRKKVVELIPSHKVSN